MHSLERSSSSLMARRSLVGSQPMRCFGGIHRNLQKCSYQSESFPGFGHFANIPDIR